MNMRMINDRTPSVTITGLDQLNRNLMKLAKDVSGPEMDSAILRAAQEMMSEMKQKALPILRETLVARLFAKTGKSTSEAYVAVDRKKKDYKGRHIGYLANIFEFSKEEPRFRKKDKVEARGLKMLGLLVTGQAWYTGILKRRPFFRPVVDEWKGEKFLSRMAAAVRSIIERKEYHDTMGGGGL